MERLVTALAAVKGREADLDARIAREAPLPEGFVDAESFLRAFEEGSGGSRGGEGRDPRPGRTQARDGGWGRRRWPTSPRRSLPCSCRDAEETFQAELRRAEALDRLLARSAELLRTSDNDGFLRDERSAFRHDQGDDRRPARGHRDGRSRPRGSSGTISVVGAALRGHEGHAGACAAPRHGLLFPRRCRRFHAPGRSAGGHGPGPAEGRGGSPEDIRPRRVSSSSSRATRQWRSCSAETLFRSVQEQGGRQGHPPSLPLP